ncbi:hypothetical protein EMCRGX_G024211 [Ephydatia muelleri]
MRRLYKRSTISRPNRHSALEVARNQFIWRILSTTIQLNTLDDAVKLAYRLQSVELAREHKAEATSGNTKGGGALNWLSS